LKLPVYEKSAVGIQAVERWATAPAPETSAGVHFYGFRQIEENPVFYALAEAFILPSLYEEWGLVVNEAMACGLPVIVSDTVGCAEDLLEECGAKSGWPEYGDPAIQDAKLKIKYRANGMVFDPGSSAELSGVLAQMAAAPAVRMAMGKAGRCIVEKFSCAAFARNALLAVQAASGDTLP
jgi:glycosyltransferase involved in cell wall biosynthesis